MRMNFTGVWQDYQARVLAEMETYLGDQWCMMWVMDKMDGAGNLLTEMGVGR